MTTWLACLGTIPFVIGAIFTTLGYQQLFFVGDLALMVESYGLIIVVFMSGVHWGHYLSDKNCHSINLLITSNVITLISWFAFLILSVELILIVYCLAFSILLYIDAKLLSIQVINKPYYKLRLIITTIVILSLLIVAFNSIK